MAYVLYILPTTTASYPDRPLEPEMRSDRQHSAALGVAEPRILIRYRRGPPGAPPPGTPPRGTPPPLGPSLVKPD